jgi:hypothetical protein
MKHFLILLFFILAGNCFSQSNNQALKSHLFFEGGYRTGKILDIYPDSPKSGQTRFYEMTIGWQMIGAKKWDQFYNFPQVGVMLSFGDLGNKSVLGYNISAVPHINVRLFSSQRLSLYSKFGLGFSYFTKPYNRIHNNQNILMGSRLAAVVNISLDLNYQISNYFIISTGVSAQHFSTAHVQIPNVGINIPSFNIGLKYFPKEIPKKYYLSDSLFLFNNRILFNTRIGIGFHEFASTVHANGGPKYPIYNGSLYLSKRVARIANIHLGLHYNYYASFYDFIIANDFYEKNQRMKSSSLITFVGLEFIIGKFGFLGQFGVFLYNPLVKDLQELNNNHEGFKNVSKRVNANKLGVQYYIFDPLKSTKQNPFIGIYLKSNAGQADFAEISIGCAF